MFSISCKATTVGKPMASMVAAALVRARAYPAGSGGGGLLGCGAVASKKFSALNVAMLNSPGSSSGKLGSSAAALLR